MDGFSVKFYLKWIAFGVAAVSLAIVVNVGPRVFRQLAAEDWPSVDGVVRDVVARQQVDGKNNIRFYGRPVYAWNVDGKEYKSDQLSFVPGPLRRDPVDALADVSRFERGMEVPVYYNLADPSIGILEREIPSSDVKLLLGAIVGILVGGGITVVTIRDLIVEFRSDLAIARQEDDKAAAEEEPLDRPLGERIELFQPALRNVLAGAILAALLTTTGLGFLGYVGWKAQQAGWRLPLKADRQMSWAIVGFGSLVGLGAIFGGYVLWRYVEALRDTAIEVCENGFRYRIAERTNEVSWSMVQMIRETVLHERSLILKPPFNALLPRTTSRHFAIVTRSGKQYKVDGNIVRQIDRFAQLLLSAASDAGIPWSTAEESD